VKLTSKDRFLVRRRSERTGSSHTWVEYLSLREKTWFARFRLYTT